MRKRRTIAYVSGTRADFGLMTPVLHAIHSSKKLRLYLYATHLHLSRTFGGSLKYVKAKFPDVRIIQAVSVRDTPAEAAIFASKFIARVNSEFTRRRPEMVLLLGDRIEMLCTALVCHYLHIPCGHIHGGEKTTTVDESTRHAITKLSHLHFPATRHAAERIRKMGEDAWRIHVVGAPALDVIRHTKLPDRQTLFAQLGLARLNKFILVTQHPVSEQWRDAARHMRETLAAVQRFSLPVVVVYPNADPGGRAMIKEIEKERHHPLFHVFKNLAHEQFLSLEREAAVWVGNSSAAMIESPSFKTPVVNIGRRQRGREHGDNIVNVEYNRDAIARAIRWALSNMTFRRKLRMLKNPWGDGHAAERIVRIIETIDLGPRLLNKVITY